MIDEAAALAALERCRKIEWRQDDTHADSTFALVSEYLRRAAVVAAALGGAAEWPFFDASALVTLPSVDSDTLLGPLEEKFTEFNVHLDKIPQGAGTLRVDSYGRSLCAWYIRWAALKNDLALAAQNLPDLYEPLIVMYERGGSFTRHHGEIEIFPNISLQPGSPERWLSREPLTALDSETLDQIDRER